MSNEIEEELKKAKSPQKLAKVDVSIFDDGNTHCKCFLYNEEGPKGKSEAWRVPPKEVLVVGKDCISYLKDFLGSYKDCGKTGDKPVKIAQLIVDVDTALVADPDYVLFEEMGVKGKRRATRPGIEEWIRGVRSHVGELVVELVPSGARSSAGASPTAIKTKTVEVEEDEEDDKE